MKRDQLISHLVHQDWEVPPQNLKGIRSRAFARSGVCTFPDRLGDATHWLLAHPLDPAAVELYLTELVGATRREVGGRVALATTFADYVAGISDDVHKALPAHAKSALKALVKVVTGADGPVPINDPWQIGHALAIEGKLVEWLLGDEAKETRPKGDDFQKVRRELQQKYHPDRQGGDPEVAADINRLVNAAKGRGGK